MVHNIKERGGGGEENIAYDMGKDLINKNFKVTCANVHLMLQKQFSISQYCNHKTPSSIANF